MFVPLVFAQPRKKESLCYCSRCNNSGSAEIILLSEPCFVIQVNEKLFFSFPFFPFMKLRCVLKDKSFVEG